MGLQSRLVSWSLGTSAKASVVGEPSGAIPHGVQCILVSLAAPCLKCQKGGGVFLAQLLWCGCTHARSSGLLAHPTEHASLCTGATLSLSSLHQVRARATLELSGASMLPAA